MAIPQQVRQQSKRTDDLIRGQAQPQQPENEEVTESEEVAEQNQETEEVEQQEAPEAVEQQTEEQEFAVEKPDDVAKKLAEMQERLEGYDQKYKTLQGMVRHKEDENQRLQALLAQLSQPAEEAKEDTTAKPSSDEMKDREDFGEDFVDMVNRAIDRRLSKLEERLGKTEGLANESYATTKQTQQERFEAKLTERVPNWREIDVTQDFKDWLSSSKTRIAIVREGMANYDPNAIAEIFELYTQLTGKGQAEQQKPEPAGAKLEGKVAPSKGRASKPASGSGEKKTWTRTEIAEVFNNRRSYAQKEFQKLQNDIFAAQKEGRVDYSR